MDVSPRVEPTSDADDERSDDGDEGATERPSEVSPEEVPSESERERDLPGVPDEDES
jgi:hypothetical protein